MTTHSLSAWINDLRVGALYYHDDTGLFSFTYDPTWGTRTDAYPISPALPFQRPEEQTDELHSVNVRRFLENLLPEGKALEDAAATYSVSKNNLFGLLRWLGTESTGAVALLPEGKTPAQVNDVKREVTIEELAERIRDRTNHPFNVWDGKVRLSIAGYQDKVAMYSGNKGRLYLVEGRLASTHILKPEPLNPKLKNLVANEHFCLKLAATLGIPTAEANILRVPDPVLIIKRFDRVTHRRHVERIHALDSCQALNLGVNHKYERNFGNERDVAHIRDGMSLEKLFSIASLTQSEATTRMILLRWTILQYLIGNSDAHGKNISFFVGPAGMQLAPAYDLVSVCIYPDIDHEFAMAIGDEFNPAKVRAFDWADFAERCHLPRQLLVREMKRMIKVVRAELSQLLSGPGYTDDERNTLQSIAKFVINQARQIELCAQKIPEVKLI